MSQRAHQRKTFLFFRNLRFDRKWLVHTFVHTMRRPPGQCLQMRTGADLSRPGYREKHCFGSGLGPSSRRSK